ncbi:MAG: threonylcarbamoyl-AMP synthase [Ignavibacteriales bacterium]|nr:threonylcarbamoyl-AMP synthase [Ignavibacteriales bacterium]
MKLLEATTENINSAVQVLKDGGLVAFPTETVYGIGANGFDPIAVAKIFEVKKRPAFNPLILHISSIEMLDKIAEYSNSKIKFLIDKFWPGPLTLILPKKEIVPYIVTSGLETVAVRMPNNKVALELISKLGKPIAAPSANSFSRLSPTKAEHVVNQLGENIDIILDGGNCQVGVESTIIEILEDKQLILRPGGIPTEEIEKAIGKLSGSENVINPNSPGQLQIHYAPKIPIKFYSESELEANKNKKIGVIFFNESKFENHFDVIKILSKTGDLREAASKLFAFLHELENLNLDLILVEPVEKSNLGIAIMDRLTKAVNKYL